jgi:predicted nucleic acid-binding protein
LILADTSVWIDHLRHGDTVLTALLEQGRVLCHPFIVGELALGSLKHRSMLLGALQDLPKAIPADVGEVLAFIEAYALHGRGIGYVDAHLLASVRLTPGASFWTRDRRLKEIASALGLAAAPLSAGASN